jgi:hypothetical protein
MNDVQGTKRHQAVDEVCAKSRGVVPEKRAGDLL